MATTTRINVWSGPRNVSTALMYAFRQRPDTRVVDEPLYAHYLATTSERSEHPLTDAVVASMSPDAEVVADTVICGPTDHPVLFFKQMAHHLVPGVPSRVLTHCVNVLLIRDPVEVLTTVVRQLPNPTMVDIGIARELALLHELRELGQEPPVVDAKRLQNEPERVLSELCARVGIGWDPVMLSWPAGAKPEDGVWAPAWYANAHTTTGFLPHRPKAEAVPEHVTALAVEATLIYDELLALAI
ncbi:MAG TPA: hypothetical protein VGM80_16510 [Gaiellaceae bacterium]